MKVEPNIPKQLFIVDGEKIERILRRAVRHALLEHKRAGNTIAAWEGGQVVLIPAEEIDIKADAEDIAED